MAHALLRMKGQSYSAAVHDPSSLEVHWMVSSCLISCHSASGVYPPQVRVFELAELSLKFERNLDSEIVEFLVSRPRHSRASYFKMHAQVSWLGDKMVLHLSLGEVAQGHRCLCICDQGTLHSLDSCTG